MTNHISYHGELDTKEAERRLAVAQGQAKGLTYACNCYLLVFWDQSVLLDHMTLLYWDQSNCTQSTPIFNFIWMKEVILEAFKDGNWLQR